MYVLNSFITSDHHHSHYNHHCHYHCHFHSIRHTRSFGCKIYLKYRHTRRSCCCIIRLILEAPSYSITVRLFKGTFQNILLVIIVSGIEVSLRFVATDDVGTFHSTFLYVRLPNTQHCAGFLDHLGEMACTTLKTRPLKIISWIAHLVVLLSIM